MKTNKHILIQVAAAAAAAAAVTLVACTDDMGLGFSNPAVHNPTEEICFTTSGTVGQSAEPFTRHADYVEETDEEWEVFGTDTADVKAGTRRDAEESLYDYFSNAGVRIFLYDGEWGPSNTTYIQVPTAAELATVPALPGTFNADGLLSPVTPILWSESKAYHYAMDGQRQFFEHFRAYAFSPLNGDEKNGNRGIDNLSAAGKTEYDHGSMGNPPTITYEVPNAPQDQVDLIAAYSGEVDGDYCKAVPLTFKHALAAVQFKLGFEATTRVKSLTISGVYNRGKGSFDPTTGDLVVTPVTGAIGSGSHPEITPSNPATSADLYSYTYAYKGSGPDYTEYEYSGGSLTNDGVLTDGDNTLMMIPQTLPEGATLILEYYVYEASNWVAKTITCDISGFQWKSGHRYIYTIKEEPSYDIYFDIAAGNVTINGSTYTGYVYKNTSTTPERVTITGTHSASNRYYIYQSVPSGTTGYEYTPGYNKGWTGDIDGTGKVPGAGSILELPKYDEVMSPDGSKTWSDYVTGNSAAHDITNDWETVAKQVKRARSTYKISISADIGAQVVLDNVWATNEDNFGANNSATGHRPYVLNGTVYLKGVNHLTKVTPSSDKELNFTSYYGDGSYKGFLQCTREKDTPFGYCGHTMLGYDGGEGTVTRINVLGGTLYVATTTENYSNDAVHTNNRSKNNACFSSPNNGAGYINISGGRVTAVSRSTSAAIGGGGGSQGFGGNGFVNISGNSIVYAYQRGEYCTNSKFTTGLRSTAIGGGSSFCSNSMRGEVTISGNAYVYAESIGGVAIGGGSSEGALGGNGVVTISGNPTVIAKSVSGYINGKSGNKIYVTAGTAIGGGAGGDWTGVAPHSGQSALPNVQQTSANGGNAEVRIMGGKILTGSIGGGKEGVNYPNVKKGFAKVYISNGEVQAQALMAKGGTENCVFEMTNGKLSLSDDSFEFVEKNGGAVWMDEGDCTITGGTITDFKAQNGGAVYMEGGTFTMTGGTIQNCRANYNSSSSSGGKGGAVYIADASGSATLNLSGSAQIKNSFADWNGGGIYLEGGNVNVTGGDVSVNKALGVSAISATEKGNGAGIYLMKGNYTQSGGTISGNTATRNGGGIYVSSETTDLIVNITGGSITSNVSEHFGAGLFVKPGGGRSATVNIGTAGSPYGKVNPEITGNSASLRGGGIYAEGTNAALNLYDGKIKNNYVSAYVYNQDITNEGGSVLLELDNEGLPAPDLNYITVAFDPNGGNFTDGNSAGTPAYRFLVTSTNSTLDIPTPKRKNFKFIGWLPSIGESVTHVSTWTSGMIFNFYKDITLTAQWELAM